MSVGAALDRLLSRLQPDSPVDAELAEAGLMIDDAIEALVVRALALDSPLGRTDLAAFVAAAPRPAELRGGLKAVGAAARRLVRRGLVEGPADGPYRLAERLVGRVAHFPRLVGPGAEAPALHLPDARRILSASRGPLTATALAAIDDADGDLEAWSAVLDGIRPPGRALADWVGAAILAPPLRITLAHGMARVVALAEQSMGITPDARQAFGATWITFVEALGRVLDPALLAAHDDRRTELLRRWAWFVGCPVQTDGVEPPLISAAALVRLDWRRIQADTRALDVMRRAEAAAESVLTAERERRAAAAKAYASGRRE